MAIDIPNWLRILLIWFGQRTMHWNNFKMILFFLHNLYLLFFRNRVKKNNNKET